MKFFQSFLLFAIIFNCANLDSGTKTSEFDRILGEMNVETIDFLVADFESDFLRNQYPHLDTAAAYRQFLMDLRDDKTQNWRSLSESSKDRFKSSDLRLEMYEFPDSVWILENSTFDKIESDSLTFLESATPYIKSRYKIIDVNGNIEYSYSRSYVENIIENQYDSIINLELKTARFNYAGKYLSALQIIKDKGDFYKELYETKKAIGILQAKSTAEVMLNYNIDLKDKLNRKLIILELVY
ncbi:MAG: hypothetical protein ACWA5P_10920 [bacterium]